MIPQFIIHYAHIGTWGLALCVLLGLLFLMLGGDGLCRGASSLALRFQITPVVVGLTVVSAATSAPELMTSLYGASHGSSDIAMGNILGSNLTNSGLILGLCALVSPILVDNRLIKQELPFLLGVTLLFSLFAFYGGISRPAGVSLLLVHWAYLLYIVRRSRRETQAAQEIEAMVVVHKDSWIKSLALILLSSLALSLGAELLVNSALETGNRLGVSDLVMGITVVGLGTSLPELAACLMASLRGESALCVGNIVGSNLFNLMFIGGGVASVYPLQVNPVLMLLEVPSLVLMTFLVSLFIINDRIISRKEGAALGIAYFVIIGASFYLQDLSFSL